MKTNEDFKMAVLEKHEARQKRRKTLRNRCLMIALPILCVSVLLATGNHPSLISGLRDSGENSIKTPGTHPASLQILNPAPPEELSQVALMMDRELAFASGEGDYDEESYDRRWAEIQEKRSENLISMELVNSVNSFTRDSFSLLAKENSSENLLYSPLSLYMALALTGNGAQGETERELLEVLHAPDFQWLSEQCGKYYRQHYQKNDYSQFTLANSLWLGKGMSFKQGFLDTAETSFYASLFQADFQNPDLPLEIKSWISDNTEGLLSPEINFSPEDCLAIINTVYLYDQWTNEFSESANTQAEFYKENGGTVQATYMHTTELGNVLRGEDFTRATLDLRSGQMHFILPDEGITPEQLLEDPNTFEEMLMPQNTSQLEYITIQWSVPKFAFGSQLNLNTTLGSLGLKSAFSPSDADFSSMTDDESLFISSAIQGTHIGIDEKGVEAAAYTAIVMCDAGMPTDIVEVEMNLNRPFIFAITSSDALDTDTVPGNGAIMFIGVCGDPSA